MGERFNAAGISGRDCPTCYRVGALTGDRVDGASLTCNGCYTRFRFDKSAAFGQLERIPTPVPQRATLNRNGYNSGARIADDHSCSVCGRRGVIGVCATCDRAA